MPNLIPAEYVESHIFLIRSRKVMLDRDLARLYRISTTRLNQQVNRNISRFPPDFMLQLTPAEMSNWMLQYATSNFSARMGIRKPPNAFTEQGIAMLSSVLRSERAVVRLRELLLTHADLARRLAALERKYDGQFKHVFDAIKRVMRQRRSPRPV